MQYFKTMARNEPVTFLVGLLMVAILIFGAWDTLHVVQRNVPVETTAPADTK
jgi:hypothetical protein